MYRNKTIGVVVPAYNEQKLIGRVIETMPEFVDKIVIVDDCSKDGTSQIVQQYQMEQTGRIELIRHTTNQGVGGAIASGYKWCRDHQLDITAVMAGDAQMDPSDLQSLVELVANDETDYAKGNRLISGDAWRVIPKLRYFGNSALSLLTKIASGYWHIADSQTGYAAANLKVLKTIDLDSIYKGYGMPNDLLVKLNINDFRVRDVSIHPVYGIGESSGIRPLLIVPKLAGLVFKLFITRMVQKYIIRDFHPLVFFYAFGILLLLASLIFGCYVLYYRLLIGFVGDNTPLFTVFLFISGWQFILFAMWFDMDYNKRLR